MKTWSEASFTAVPSGDECLTSMTRPPQSLPCSVKGPVSMALHFHFRSLGGERKKKNKIKLSLGRSALHQPVLQNK